MYDVDVQVAEIHTSIYNTQKSKGREISSISDTIAFKGKHGPKTIAHFAGSLG